MSGSWSSGRGTLGGRPRRRLLARIFPLRKSWPPQTPQGSRRARAICAKCPVLVPCLEGAIERREPWGVWGGQLFLNGKILASKRRRGRPPKVPRPEDQLPDIPIPEHLRSA